MSDSNGFELELSACMDGPVALSPRFHHVRLVNDLKRERGHACVSQDFVELVKDYYIS